MALLLQPSRLEMSKRSNRFKSFLIIWVLLLCIPGNIQSADKIKLVIGGAGPSTTMTTLLAGEFCRRHPEYEISVPTRSIKHRGGLQWVTERGQLLGRLGRPLGPKDREEFPSARALPFAFVKVGFAVPKELGIKNLTLAQWHSIYLGEVDNWSFCGGPDQSIVRLGRKPGESVFRTIVYSYPDFTQSTFVNLLDRDDQMVRAIGRTPGSIGFSDLLALDKHPDLQVLEIEGFDCLLETGLVFDQANAQDEALGKIREFVASEHWRDFLVANVAVAPLDSWREKVSPRMQKILDGRIRAVQKMAVAPILVRMVKRQNEQQLTMKQIQEIDEQWIQGGHVEFAQSLQTNPAGQYLKKMVKGNSMIYVAAFVCGNQGTVVGEFPRTTDFWQGDERKFTNCFRSGAGVLYVGKCAFDESRQMDVVQISVPVMDGREAIGVLIVAIRDIENIADQGIN